VMARASAIACGHKDGIDLDRLRDDPLMKLAVGRCPQSGAALASQSTISRLKNAPSKKRLRQHWPNTRIAWRGDSHYGRVEAMEWAEDNGEDYIFGLAGNATLDALVADTTDNLRFHHAKSSTL
jgi:hypothetical protein